LQGVAIVQQDAVGVLRPRLLNQGGGAFQTNALVFGGFVIVVRQDVGVNVGGGEDSERWFLLR